MVKRILYICTIFCIPVHNSRNKKKYFLPFVSQTGTFLACTNFFYHVPFGRNGVVWSDGRLIVILISYIYGMPEQKNVPAISETTSAVHGGCLSFTSLCSWDSYHFCDLEPCNENCIPSLYKIVMQYL